MIYTKKIFIINFNYNMIYIKIYLFSIKFNCRKINIYHMRNVEVKIVVIFNKSNFKKSDLERFHLIC